MMKSKNILLIFFLITAFNHPLIANPRMDVQKKLEKLKIVSGVELKGEILLKNTGDELLKIYGVSSSCGCTTYRLEKRKLEPDEEVKLNFVIDTRGELGWFEKEITIHTNDPDSPFEEIVKYHALSNEMIGAEAMAIFSPPCSGCHLDKGIGLKGGELYQGLCEACHIDSYFELDAAALTNVISHGRIITGMPGYSNHLSPKQIQSLVEYLENE